MAGASIMPTVQNLPNGCEDCDLTGYRGRVGIYEMLVFDDAIRAAVRDGSNAETVRTMARRGGMRMMCEYAIDQVAAGTTTMEEVERVVPVERVKTGACGSCMKTLAGNFVFCPYCGVPATSEADTKPQTLDFVGQIAVNE